MHDSEGAIVAQGANKKDRDQDMMYPENWLTSDDWKCILSKDASKAVKLQRLCRRMIFLKCLQPKERSKAQIASIVILADPSTLLKDTPLNTIREFKRHLTSMSQRIDRTTAPKEYPEDPQEFRMMYPGLYESAYADAQPVECQLDRQHLEQMRATLGCRGPRSQTGLMKGLNPQMKAMLQHVVRGMPMLQCEQPLAGLRFFPPRQHMQEAAQAIEYGDVHMVPRPIQCGGDQPVARPLQLLDRQHGLTDNRLQDEQSPAEPIQGSPVVAGGKSPALAKQSLGTMMEEMQKMFDKRNADEPGDEIEEEDQETATEALAIGKGKDAKKESVKVNAKVKVKAIAKGKARTTETKKVAKDLDALKFAGKKAMPPRRYGLSTIYTNTKRTQWRVKLEPGMRYEKNFCFGPETDPKAQWKKLVEFVKEHNP